MSGLLMIDATMVLLAWWRPLSSTRNDAHPTRGLESGVSDCSEKEGRLCDRRERGRVHARTVVSVQSRQVQIPDRGWRWSTVWLSHWLDRPARWGLGVEIHIAATGFCGGRATVSSRLTQVQDNASAAMGKVVFEVVAKDSDP